MIIYHKRYSRYIFMEDAMTRTGTKTSLKRQPVRKTKMDKVYADVKRFTNDKAVADKLIEKYGVECAYAIVRQCMQEPGNVVKRINPQSKMYKTSDVIKYFANTELNDAAVAKGIKKTSQFVANSKKSKNNTPAAQDSRKKVEIRTAVRKTTKNKTKSPQKDNGNQTETPLLARSVNRRNHIPQEKVICETDAIKTPQPVRAVIDKTEYNQLSSGEQAEAIYNKLKKENGDNISIEDLLKYGGVKGIDIQNVFEENKEYFAQLQPGKTNKDLAARANRVSGRCEGGCLAGVQGMCPELDGQNPNWPKKEYGSSYNSACNAPEVLQKGGKYVVVEVENRAFGKGAWSPEDREMREFNKTLPGGTIAALDNYKPDELYGRRTPSDSQKHGHVWIQDNKGVACSDGRQPDGPSFSRYGRKMFICVAKDCQVPKEIAIELIKAAQERQRETQNSFGYAKANQIGR